MLPENNFFNFNLGYWELSKEEMLQIFPELGNIVIPPHKKRGRRPKAFQNPDCSTEMKASI